MEKIFFDAQTGSAYWLEGDEVAFAPMHTDGTFDKDESGIVEVWSEESKEAAIAEEARIRAELA